MRNVFQLRFLFILAIGALWLTSCEDEPGTGGPDVLGPTITLNSDAALTLAPGEEFTVSFSADDRDALLKAITVFENGISMPNSRLKVNGTAAASNPIGIVLDEDKSGIDWTISIIAQSIGGTTANFEIEVQDDNDEKSAIAIEVTTVSNPPVLSTSSPLMGMAEQDAKYTFRVSGEKGGGNLANIEVRENNQLVDPSRIFWKVITSSVAENPFSLDATDAEGFSSQELIVMTPMSEGTFTYEVTLTDEFDEKSVLTFEVTTLPLGTPVELREDEILNKDGEDPGGLDLDTGDNVASSSMLAEIIDNGIDTDLPANDNWLQTISPVNGTTMRYVVAGAEGIPEGFTFDGVATKEEVSALYTQNTGEIIDETKSSSVVIVGDTFVVNNGDKYWLITVTDVVVTDNDNTDKYVLDVKF